MNGMLILFLARFGERAIESDVPHAASTGSTK